jgi:TatA/E family protein of Tat protein translocase
MALPNIGPIELIIVVAIVLLVVGPRRLPEMGRALGSTISEFRRSATDVESALAGESVSSQEPASDSELGTESSSEPASR